MKKNILLLCLTVCFLSYAGAVQASHEVLPAATAGNPFNDSEAFAGVMTESGYLTISNDTQSTFNLYINGAFIKVIAANEHSTLPISTEDGQGSIGVSAIDYTTHTIEVIGDDTAHYSTTSIYAYFSDVYLTPYSSLHIY